MEGDMNWLIRLVVPWTLVLCLSGEAEHYIRYVQTHPKVIHKFAEIVGYAAGISDHKLKGYIFR
jgi:hypothetical protein